MRRFVAAPSHIGVKSFFYLVEFDGTAYIVSLPVMSAVLLVRGPPPPHGFVISSGSHGVWLPALSALALVAVCHFWGTAIQQLISSVSSSGCSVAGVEQTTVWVKRTAVFYTLFHLIMDHRGRYYEPLKPIKCFRSVLRPSSRNHVIGSQRWIVWNGS